MDYGGYCLYIYILKRLVMGNLLTALQQEDTQLGTPKLETYVVIEKDIEKLWRKLNQMKEQWWYPRNWEYVLILNRWNADANWETTDGVD